MKPNPSGADKPTRTRGFRGLLARWMDAVISFLVIPSPEASQLLRRIILMERDIILPLKVAGIGMLLFSFYFRPWVREVLGALEIAVEATQYFLWFYIAANLVVAAALLSLRRLSINLVQWIVFMNCLLDGLFLSALTLVTGGYNSLLYWLFLPLIARSAVSVPRATSQLVLNLTLSACYVIAGSIDGAIATYLDEESLETSGLAEPMEYASETLFLRLVVLLFMTACSYGVQLLVERQRRVFEEAREFAVREGQLRSAGRVAAEFVHQIKNPLAIINNAAYSLEKALRDGRQGADEQVRIIQEEVARSDQIITQVMDYAQLSEGRVEKLDVLEELEEAIRRVFPPGAGYPIEVHRDFGSGFPPLLMQRRHLSDTFINLLQNAREAFDGRAGNVWVSAHPRGESSIEVVIRDDGPGIPRDRYERIFEAYYTTKKKGTGLGLASVKHNVELYGGKVRVESELGKGARFSLVFPARALLDIPAQSE